MDQVESILLIQKRYHTNQHPVVAAFLDAGHEVNFLSLDRERNEEYSRLSPDFVEFSPVVLMLHSILCRLLVTVDLHRVGIPAPLWYYRYLRRVDPDIIVVKKYLATSLVTILYAKALSVNLVFYDQAPLYDDDPLYIKRRIVMGVYYVLHGERFVRYTPVLGDPKQDLAIPRSYYIPFVAPPAAHVDNEVSDVAERIRVMMVGTLWSKRKNHLMLVRAVAALVEDHDLTLTIVGSLDDPVDPYFERLLATVEDAGLEGRVEIKRNISYQAVQEEYASHDLYVLPSKSEPAAVSPLEAMTQGLPVICSETNGTSCYVRRGVNGFLFDPTDQAELTDTIDRLISSPRTMRAFGRSSRHLARTQYSSDRFYQRFASLVRENFE